MPEYDEPLLYTALVDLLKCHSCRQELIAPLDVIFYDMFWAELGTKISLSVKISSRTGISSQVLVRPAAMTRASIAERMSWAASRSTTRVEDRAYCLMGLFDVNMPLIYGEGPKAFQRLQMQILSSSSDQSILAWKRNKFSTAAHSITSGVLAVSPADFGGLKAGSERSSIEQGMVLDTDGEIWGDQSTTVSNLGISISVPVITIQNTSVAVLNCHRNGKQLGIFITKYPGGHLFSRVQPADLAVLSEMTRLPKTERLNLIIDANSSIDRARLEQVRVRMVNIIPPIEKFEIHKIGEKLVRVVQKFHFITAELPILPIDEHCLKLQGTEYHLVTLRDRTGRGASILFGTKYGRLWSYVIERIIVDKNDLNSILMSHIPQDGLREPLTVPGLFNDRYSFTCGDCCFDVAIKRRALAEAPDKIVFDLEISQRPQLLEHTKGQPLQGQHSGS
jgi:hypothetical protein